MSTDADRLREQLDKLGLSQHALARELEISEREVRHLASGHGKVPRWLWLALDQLSLLKQIGQKLER